jgi:hypothetical protein
MPDPLRAIPPDRPGSLQGRHTGMPLQPLSISATPGNRPAPPDPVRAVPRDRPSPPLNPPGSGSCPVHILARQTLTSARSLARLLSRLRISLKRCHVCPTSASCPLPAEFNAQLTIALQEIADEWRLGGESR